MRWKAKPWQNPRIIRRFLIFPRCIGAEWRWLEWARIEQRFVGSVADCYWEDIRWVDDD